MRFLYCYLIHKQNNETERYHQTGTTRRAAMAETSPHKIKDGWNWDTKLITAYGLNSIGGSKFLKKTDDKLEINSARVSLLISLF